MIGERLYGKYGKEKHLDILQKEYSGKKQKEGSEHYRKMIGLPPREEKSKDGKRKVHPKADQTGREANGAGNPQAD